jgi:intein/homing endonuclease
MPILKQVNQDFFKTWTPEMAYVLGFFAADGNMCIHKNGGKYIEFTSCDKEILIKIRKSLESNHKISTRFRDTKSYRIQLGSKEIYEDLLKLGMVPTKSFTLKFPFVPEQHRRDFIRGYFDGDGCVSIGKYWRKSRSHWRWEITSRFTSGSKNFLKELYKILKSYCKGGYIYRKKNDYELVFSRHDSLALSNLMYHNIQTSLYLERKRNTFQKGFRKLHLGT